MKKWNKDEINLLDKLLYNGYTYGEIGEKLNRSHRSIKSKCFKIGLSIWETQKEINYEKIECVECNKEFRDLKNNNRKFCSSSCSAKFSHKNNKRNIDYSETKDSMCIDCEKNISINIRASIKNCRCEECKNKRRKIVRYCKKCNKNEVVNRKKYCNECKYDYYHIYRPNCNFSFNLSDYPDEFDFDLIKEHGWYSPTNKNNKLDGVSRDHILSVGEGFENNIDTEIISHPANCKLMIHNENNIKNNKSDLTLDDLIKKIKIFDDKYL